MATNRSDKFTVETRKVEYYSDFTINLDKNPLTGFLARVTNEESVKQSIKSLLLTQRTERFFRPYVGSKLNALLFELATVMVDESIRREIKTTLENCEPRAKIEDIAVTYNQDRDANAINVTLWFSLVSIPEQTYSLDLIIKRIR
jgi:phage baseplate assembly protein W